MDEFKACLGPEFGCVDLVLECGAWMQGLGPGVGPTLWRLMLGFGYEG